MKTHEQQIAFAKEQSSLIAEYSKLISDMETESEEQFGEAVEAQTQVLKKLKKLIAEYTEVE